MLVLSKIYYNKRIESTYDSPNSPVVLSWDGYEVGLNCKKIKDISTDSRTIYQVTLIDGSIVVLYDVFKAVFKDQKDVRRASE